MKNKIVLLFFLQLASNLFAQDTFLKIENDLKTSKAKITQTFTIVNEDNNNLAFFFKDKDSTYSYLYNENLEQLNTLTSGNLSRKYKVFLGSSASDDFYNLYKSNEEKTKFGAISFSFKNQETTVTEFKLKFVKESFLQSISHKNKFYILSASKNALNLYLFDETGNYKKTIFDLSDKKFLNKKNQIVDLNKSLATSTFTDKLLTVQKIKSTNPNAIESAAEPVKLYIKNNTAIITIDKSDVYTQLIKIHLDNLTCETKNIKKPYIIPNTLFIKSNSFLNENTILQVIATRDELRFDVKNLETKEVLNNYYLKRTDTIKFKNSPIIQEGGTYNDYRELEKTKNFLRKITAQKIGITSYSINGKNQVTIGGIKEMKSGGAAMVMSGFGGIPLASFGAGNVFFNPTMYAFEDYSNTVSTFVNCLFDKEYNHLQGEITENIFDKINTFKEEKKNFINAETVFIYKDKIYFATCLGKSNTCIIIEFKD